jgi:uncharacterized protein YdbL (DUF1318 family)
MFGDFLLKQMLKRQGMAGEQVDALLAMVKKNPELFKQIAAEIQEKIKQGKGQQEAALEVMQAHQEELKKLTE